MQPRLVGDDLGLVVAAGRTGLGLLVGRQGLLVLGHRLPRLGDLLGAHAGRDGDGERALVADRTADLHSICEGGPHHGCRGDRATGAR